MNAKPRIGFVGVGLMGHDICKNPLENGSAVRMMAHVRRDRIEDLIARGAAEDANIGPPPKPT
jgi:3-hydroxyisobutyrate dehydrogenase-like beta-hydroxyacid dehydrogenase